MQRICRWLLATMLAMACATVVHAAAPEVPRFRVLGVRDGLPSNTVTAMARDRAGFLWIATNDGLARYDGIGVKVWQHDPDDPASLPGNQLLAVHVDAQDRIWVSVDGLGLSVLDTQRRGFRRVHAADVRRGHAEEVWALASRGGEVWFGTVGDGLQRIDASGRITRFLPVAGDPHSLPSATVPALEFAPDGRLWVGTRDGLAVWNGRGFTRVPLPGDEPDAIVYAVRWLHDALWVGTDTGLYRLRAGRWEGPAWSAMFGRPNVAMDIAADSAGRHWIASARGLWHAEPGAPPHPGAGGEGTRPQAILQLLRDTDGALWAPLPGKGLGYLRAGWRDLVEYRAGESLHANSYVATAPAVGGGHWLLGANGELDRLDADGNVAPVPGALRQALRGHKPTSVVEDASGHLWLGEWDALLRLSPDGRLQRWHMNDPVDGALGGANGFLQLASDGSIWVASNGNGLQQRDGASGVVLREMRDPSNPLVLQALSAEPDGTLWVATRASLQRWDGRRLSLEQVPGIHTRETALAFAFDGPGTLWVQRPSGLERYRRDGNRWQRIAIIGSAAGLPAVEASGMVIDHLHRVWLATPRGLYRYDPATHRLRHFGIDEGLSGQEIARHSLSIDTRGALVAALDGGHVVRLDARAPDSAPADAQLRFDRVETRRDGVWQALDPVSPRLAADDRELRVQLRYPAFADPQGVRFSTWLEGYDRGWVIGSGSDPGERVFAGLRPGEYVLRARAHALYSGRDAERVLRFRVLPPWWRTVPALLAFALLAACLLVGMLQAQGLRRQRRERLRMIQRERELAEEASRAKTHFLSTLGHEVRTPMTGVLGMTELLLETPLNAQQRGYAEAIRGAGEHLLDFVNDALDMARIEAGRLEIDDASIDLHALLDDLRQWTAPLASRRGLAFALTRGEVPRWVRGDATRLRQILLNLLGNALKFTADGRVWLHVETMPRGLRFEVGDTGPGLDAAQRECLFQRFAQGEGAREAAQHGSSGLGLAICRELALAMHGSLQLDSATGVGCRFVLALPLAAVPAPLEQALPLRAHGPQRVLLVEDDAVVAEVIRGLLGAQGHEVTHVAHGLAALAAIATQTFDVALLDLDLPGLDGCGLARQLRLLGFDLPLVAITARVDVEAESAAMAAGFDRFVRKPVTGAVLRALLRAAPLHSATD